MEEMSKARSLALQWVWKLEFNLNFNELLMLQPATVTSLVNTLREQNKDPMEWTETECEEFVLAVSQSAIPAEIRPAFIFYLDKKETPTPLQG